jgi:hypothetical protein
MFRSGLSGGPPNAISLSNPGVFNNSWKSKEFGYRARRFIAKLGSVVKLFVDNFCDQVYPRQKTLSLSDLCFLVPQTIIRIYPTLQPILARCIFTSETVDN